ncbi:transcription elongation factor GreAB [Spirosoma sp. HMF3257]|uniref:Transcription elongation factor GreAB n=1 Tax=Spirosoma telluris TaxID=2183553 RepID=A0A327NGM2_9BACT|nr:transcription elongation factor GreAB [Spirosoma telluris]RAI73104.1 transcription elongation factor GreAB [Spirosoma telluris]
MMTNRIISKLDYQRLKKRIEQAKINARVSPTQLMKLVRGVDGATLLDPVKIPSDVVTMNSVVSLEYIDMDKHLDICLVYPEEADGSRNRISIFAPLATALLGCQRGTVANLTTPFGSINIRINQILYQPEAAGDFSR